MLKLWEMWSAPLLQSLPVPHWPGEVLPDSVQSIGQIELNSVLMLKKSILNLLNLFFTVSSLILIALVIFCTSHIRRNIISYLF